MKKAFSLIELIFMIVVMGIIATVAVPRLIDMKNTSVVSTLKQDIATTISSVRGYYLLNGKIDKISDAVTINQSNWSISDKQINYIEDGSTCASITVNSTKLDLIINKDTGTICQKLYDSGIVTNSYKLK